MPLVTNSLRGEHTDTDTHTYIYTCHGQDQFLETRHALACGQRVPGLKIV